MYKIADNIVSPLGWTTEENWNAVVNLQSGLQFHDDLFDLPESFFGAWLPDDRLSERFSRMSHQQHLTKCEKMAVLSIADAFQQVDISPESQEVVFVFSTTKGNVELLEDLQGYEPTRPYLWRMAEVVARFFGNPNPPVVVSNACISGCAAQITADRLLAAGPYRYVVVCGVDVLSKFVISGFQSFKALSPERCRPFDENRLGLNLGEAAATMIYRADEQESSLTLLGGYICNDANHISAPSRTAEGLVTAIERLFEQLGTVDAQHLAFINAHGTATRYNDDMESVAIQRLNLSHLPVNSLKGYFGHTLGAAGVLETIISSKEIAEGWILPSVGCETPGTVAPLKVVQKMEKTDKPLFLKMISGFGGSNAAVLYAKNKDVFNQF